MVRDGGSLAAIFQGTNGTEYWLFFKVNLQELPSGEVERLGYEKPVVFERQAGSGSEVTWCHAKILLNQMRPMLREEAHHQWLDSMCSVAEANGQVPSGIERIFGKPVGR
jgi:hypothetical protein